MFESFCVHRKVSSTYLHCCETRGEIFWSHKFEIWYAKYLLLKGSIKIVQANLFTISTLFEIIPKIKSVLLNGIQLH